MQISKAVLSLVQFLACSALGPSLGEGGGGVKETFMNRI